MMSLRAIAEVTKELAVSLRPEDCPVLVDFVLTFLEEHGMHAQKKKFLRMLKKIFATESIRVGIVTRSGQTGVHGPRMAATIEKKCNKPVTLEELADPALIGGACLTYDDERFDASLRSALETLSLYLLSPISPL